MVDFNTFRAAYGSFLRPGRILLTGHSHQAWPDVAREAQARYFDDSAEWVDDKWGQAVFPRIARVRGKILGRMGFESTDALALGKSTHELVFRLLSCLRWADRPRVVTTTGEFHSLYRQLTRLQEEGVEVVWVESSPRETLAERLIEAIDERTALVAVSAVFFEDSFVLTELEAVLARALDRGAIPLVDGYHAFNVVPLPVGPAARRSFFAGGGYKYAQFGEGICWLRVPPGCELRPAYTGWFADFAALGHERSPGRVAYGPGGDRFAGATFDPSGVYRAEAVLDHFDSFGLDVAALRSISVRQTRLLIDELAGAAPLASSGDDARRGGFVSLRVAGAEGVVEALRARGVFTDARGDLLRLGPAPYLTDDELREGARQVREVLSGR